MNAGGSATFGGTQQWSSASVFNNSGGSAVFSTDPGSVSTAPLTVIACSGSVTFSTTVHLAGLNVYSGGTVVVTSQGQSRSVLVSPIFSNAGTVDLTTCDLDLSNQPLASIVRELGQAYANGSWTGSNGITSSSAAADSTHLTSLGVIQNNQSGAPMFTVANQFDGTTPGASDILVKYTYYGDANLDGKVDGSDYSRLDNGFLNHLTGWYNGDFNYDGVVDGSDYTLIDNSFNTQGAQLNAQVAADTAQIAESATAVPEPSGLALAAVGVSQLLRRRFQMRQRSSR